MRDAFRGFFALLVTLVAVPVSVAGAQPFTVSPTSVDFGTVAIGVSASRNVTITNPASNTFPVPIDVIYLEGDVPSLVSHDFSVNNDGGFTLVPGQSVTVVVTFSPSFEGPQSDVLVIGSFNFEAFEEVPLAGTGVVAEPLIEADPEALSFGTVELGRSLTLNLRVRNEGTAPLNVQGVSIVGAGAASFAVAGGAFVVAPGSLRTLEVTFSPATTGLLEAAVRIQSDDPQQPVLDVPASGTGVVLPHIQVVPNQVVFDQIQVGSLQTKLLRVQNNGTAPLNVSAVTIAGPGAASFSVSGEAFVVAPGSLHNLDVSFGPTVVGPIDALLRIESDDPDRPVLDVPLSGVGTPPEQTVDFGPVRVGRQATTTVPVENTGTGPLNVTVRLTDDATGSYGVTPTTFVLPPGQQQALEVTFRPQQRGVHTAVMLVESAAPTLRVNLAGEGVAPTITASASLLDFGTVAVGASASRSVQVGNTGNAPLALQNPVIEGGDGQFQVTAGGGPRNVPIDGTHTIEITFTPSAEGAHTAQLRLAHDDPDQPDLLVQLTGRSTCGLTVSEDALAFEAVSVGQAASQTLVLGHTCGNTIDVRVSIDGSAAFTVTPQGTIALAPGAGQTLTVTFTAVRGEQRATLRLESDETQPPGVDVPLTGRGIAPDIILSTDDIDFGVVTVGRTVGQSFTVTNTGDGPLNVSGLALEGSDAGAFSLPDAAAFTLDPQQARSVAVAFAPRTTGNKTALLRIASNDLDTPSAVISLSGSAERIGSDGPDVVAEDTGVDLTFAVPEDLQNASGQLFFRRGGEQAYQSVPLSRNGTSFAGAIPAAFVTVRGVEYFASFALGNETFTFPPADDGPAQLRVRIDRLTPQQHRPDFALTPTVHRMVSFPLALDDARIETQLQDDYEAYDRTVWRVLRFQAEEYAEFPAFAAAPAGTAFWLVTRDGQPFDVENGTSQDLSAPAAIELAPGWNQIGAPFAFPVAWASITGSGLIQGPFFHNGTEYLPNRPTLDPWDGYFVFNPQGAPVTLLVDPVEAVGQVARVASAQALFPEASYVLQMQAEGPDAGLRDTQNYAGFADEARPGLDPMDLPEPPGLGEHLRVGFVQDSRLFAGMFQPHEGGGAQWDVEVGAVLQHPRRAEAMPVRITLAEQGQRPEGYARYVIDLDEGRILPVEDDAFTVTLTPKHPVRRLRLIVGTEAFAGAHSDGASLVPAEYALSPNYPNPFNPETVIRYGLGTSGRVLLAVYNVLGQRVRTLVDSEQRSGTYEVRWDGLDEAGRPAASGVYIYHLHADGFTAARTMLLLR